MINMKLRNLKKTKLDNLSKTVRTSAWNVLCGHSHRSTAICTGSLSKCNLHVSVYFYSKRCLLPNNATVPKCKA